MGFLDDNIIGTSSFTDKQTRNRTNLTKSDSIFDLFPLFSGNKFAQKRVQIIVAYVGIVAQGSK